MEDGVVRVLGPVRNLTAEVFGPRIQFFGLKRDSGHVVVVDFNALVHDLVVGILFYDFNFLWFVLDDSAFLWPDIGLWFVDLSFEH